MDVILDTTNWFLPPALVLSSLFCYCLYPMTQCTAKLNATYFLKIFCFIYLFRDRVSVYNQAGHELHPASTSLSMLISAIGGDLSAH